MILFYKNVIIVSSKKFLLNYILESKEEYLYYNGRRRTVDASSLNMIKSVRSESKIAA